MEILRVSDHPNNPCLLRREVKGARRSGEEKMLTGSGQGFRLRPEMETNEADERWEGGRDLSGVRRRESRIDSIP